MTPKRDPVPRASRPWNWLGGILVLGTIGGAVVAISMLLWEHVDIQALTRTPAAEVSGPLPGPTAPLAPARPAGSFPAAVYRSQASAGFFPDSSFHPRIVDRWSERLREAGGEVREVGSPEEVDALEGGVLLVAPATICLADAEIDALHRHTEAGGGLVLTWAVGARDGDCEWRGWEVVREFTASLDARQVERREALYLTIPAGLPLSHGIEAASRVELRWDAQVAIGVEGPRTYWSDWALNPAPAEAAAGVDVGAHLRAVEGGGRVAWFGFNGGEEAGPLDRARVDALFRNGIFWAAGIPTAGLMSWPDGRRAAFALTQQVGWEFENAGDLADLAQARGVPVSFFAASRIALDYPDLATNLAGAGEIGSQGIDDRPLAGLPLADQRSRLEVSRTQLRGWTGEESFGLRPPEERFDAQTVEAWRSLGGTYLVGLNNGRTGSPEIIPTEHGPVVLLPRLLKDDYNVLVQERITRPDEVARAFGEGAVKLQSLGGLALVATHSQLAGASRRIGAIGRLLDELETGDGWWLATTGQVAEWALARHEARVSVQAWSEEGLELEVAASPRSPLTGAWLEVTLPGGGEWEPWVNGTPVEFAPTPWGIAFRVGPLEAGERRSLAVRPAPEG